MQAFVAAPVSGAAAVGLTIGLIDPPFDVALKIAVFGLLVFALPATVLLGLPLYLVLRRRVRLTVITAASAGAVVGAAPALLMNLALLSQGLARNAAEVLALPLLATAPGALGGLVFWAVVARPPLRPGR